MKIALVTDAWLPQTNGVVTTLQRTQAAARELGAEIVPLTPEGLATVPCPTYPEIRLTLRASHAVEKRFADTAFDAVHIATEGPLGMAARAYCVSRSLAFTTSYHTQFPEYVSRRWPIPRGIGYAYLRRFHRPAARTLVGTDGVRRELATRGFGRLALWPRGVDTSLFKPAPKDEFDVPRPLMLYAGRVAIEKNVEAFLRLDVPGTKVVVGDGPLLAELRRRYPEVVFTGYRYGHDLARAMASADVFVFPSRTDTFGLVMLEAMACGVPVAAFPVTGPNDVVLAGVTGVLHDDLARAIEGALMLDAGACRAYAEGRTWLDATRVFLSHVVIDPAIARHSARAVRSVNARLRAARQAREPA